tara:strand:- start:2114 stop:3187 length:1074 start_codon:yes stop_codon:yes gene_type:complete
MADNGLYYDSTNGLDLTSGGSERIEIATNGTITILQEYTLPTEDGGANEVILTNGAGVSTFDKVPNAALTNSSVTVTAGTLLDNGGTVALGGTITLNVDLSELSAASGNMISTDSFAITRANGNQNKYTPNLIPNNLFPNTAGYVTKNLYDDDSTLSATRTLDQNSKNLFFVSDSDERFDVYRDNSTAVNVPRFRVQANSNYSEAIEVRTTSSECSLIRGYDPNAKAVFTVDSRGALFATSKSFLIPHPSKEGFNLRYGSLEGPEHGVYVRGKLEGDKTIELPDYWLELVDESTISVQLTPIGSHQNLYVKDIVDNTVVVGNSNILSSKIKCFYFIQAERKDIDKMVVEFSQGTSSI